MSSRETALKLGAERRALKNNIAWNEARIAQRKLEAERRALKAKIARNEARIAQNLYYIQALDEWRKGRKQTETRPEKTDGPCNCRMCRPEE